MRHSARTRLGVLTMLAALAVAACGGFSGATEAPSAAPGSEAPAASAAPSASAAGRARHADLLRRRQQRHAGPAQGLTEAYTAIHPNVTFEIETHPGGTEGDNIVKTRLATGEMSDIFWYNSGSLLQALNPTETLVDLSGEPFIENMVESYLPTVSAGDGIYGVPTESSHGRRDPVQQEGLRDQRPHRSPRRGRSSRRTTRRSRQPASRRSARRSATRGRRSSSCWPTTTTCRRPCPTSPRSTRPTRLTIPTRPPRWPASSTCRKRFEKGWYQEDFGADKFERRPGAARRPASARTTRC